MPDDFTPFNSVFVKIVPVKSTFLIEEPFNVFDVKFKLGPIMNDDARLFVVKIYPCGRELDAS